MKVFVIALLCIAAFANKNKLLEMETEKIENANEKEIQNYDACLLENSKDPKERTKCLKNVSAGINLSILKEEERNFAEEALKFTIDNFEACTEVNGKEKADCIRKIVKENKDLDDELKHVFETAAGFAEFGEDVKAEFEKYYKVVDGKLELTDEGKKKEIESEKAFVRKFIEKEEEEDFEAFFNNHVTVNLDAKEGEEMFVYSEKLVERIQAKQIKSEKAFVRNFIKEDEDLDTFFKEHVTVNRDAKVGEKMFVYSDSLVKRIQDEEIESEKAFVRNFIKEDEDLDTFFKEHVTVNRDAEEVEEMIVYSKELVERIQAKQKEELAEFVEALEEEQKKEKLCLKTSSFLECKLTGVDFKQADVANLIKEVFGKSAKEVTEADYNNLWTENRAGLYKLIEAFKTTPEIYDAIEKPTMEAKTVKVKDD